MVFRINIFFVAFAARITVAYLCSITTGPYDTSRGKNLARTPLFPVLLNIFSAPGALKNIRIALWEASIIHSAEVQPEQMSPNGRPSASSTHAVLTRGGPTVRDCAARLHVRNLIHRLSTQPRQSAVFHLHLPRTRHAHHPSSVCAVVETMAMSSLPSEKATKPHHLGQC